MSEHRRRMMNDFGGNLSREVEELMQRHVDVAGAVFDNTEVAEIVMRVARGVALAAIMVVVQQKKDEVSAADLFDIAATTLDESIRAKKPELERVLGIVAEFKRTGQRP